MKKQAVYYEPEDDVLNVWLPRESGKRIDYAEDNNGVIIHYTEDDEPVYIEILYASRFLGNNKSKTKKAAVSKASYTAVPHRIK